MTLTDQLGFAALLLNLITLIFAISQTKMTRRALEIANESIEREKMTRQIEMLPKAQFVIYVKMKLDEWYNEIQITKEQIKIAVIDGNELSIKEISERAIMTPKGLVNRFYYEKSPAWLAEIFVTAARYYYSCVGPLSSLWDEEMNKARFNLCDDIVERCEDAGKHITELYAFIDNVIPYSYLDAPASLSDEKFLGD